MIGQKLILPTRVQAEIDEIAVLYVPVLLLINNTLSLFYHNF